MSLAEDQTVQKRPEPKLVVFMGHSSLRLGLLALSATLLLGVVYSATSDRIAMARRQAELDALATVLPPTRHDNDLLADSFILDPAMPRFAQQELLGLSQARTAYLARNAGEMSGVILPLETAAGYSGPIVLLIGIDTEGVITGVRTLAHGETPGLGDQIELDESDWILTFDNRSLGNTDPLLWAVKKDGGEFDQFIGATITPRAVVGAVRKALDFYALNREVLLTLTPENYRP